MAGLSGLIGAGAADTLETLLARQEIARQQAVKEQQQAIENQMVERQQTFRENEAQRGAEQFDRTRRDRANEVGLEQMGRDRKIYDAEVGQRQIDTVLDRIKSDESIPAGVRQIIDFQRIGVDGIKPEDLISDEERARRESAKEDADVRRAWRIAEAQYGTAARFREGQTPQRHPHVVNGRTVYLTEDEVNQMGGVEPTPRQRPVTGAERQTLAFFQRAQQGEEIAAGLEDAISKKSLAGQSVLQYAPNFMQPAENQQYRQAQRAFTEARLRKESGAAIPEGEYENDARTYFAQPGDGPDIIAQKQAARKTVLEGLLNASGSAYEEFYGEPRPKGTPKPMSSHGAPSPTGGKKFSIVSVK